MKNENNFKNDKIGLFSKISFGNADKTFPRESNL